MAYPKNIKVFDKKSLQHFVVFYPQIDRYGKSTAAKKYQFITVKDIID